MARRERAGFEGIKDAWHTAVRRYYLPASGACRSRSTTRARRRMSETPLRSLVVVPRSHVDARRTRGSRAGLSASASREHPRRGVGRRRGGRARANRRARGAVRGLHVERAPCTRATHRHHGGRAAARAARRAPRRGRVAGSPRATATRRRARRLRRGRRGGAAERCSTTGARRPTGRARSPATCRATRPQFDNTESAWALASRTASSRVVRAHASVRALWAALYPDADHLCGVVGAPAGRRRRRRAPAAAAAAAARSAARAVATSTTRHRAPTATSCTRAACTCARPRARARCRRLMADVRRAPVRREGEGAAARDVRLGPRRQGDRQLRFGLWQPTVPSRPRRGSRAACSATTRASRQDPASQSRRLVAAAARLRALVHARAPRSSSPSSPRRRRRRRRRSRTSSRGRSAPPDARPVEDAGRPPPLARLADAPPPPPAASASNTAVTLLPSSAAEHPRPPPTLPKPRVLVYAMGVSRPRRVVMHGPVAADGRSPARAPRPLLLRPARPATARGAQGTPRGSRRASRSTCARTSSFCPAHAASARRPRVAAALLARRRRAELREAAGQPAIDATHAPRETIRTRCASSRAADGRSCCHRGHARAAPAYCSAGASVDHRAFVADAHAYRGDRAVVGATEVDRPRRAPLHARRPPMSATAPCSSSRCARERGRRRERRPRATARCSRAGGSSSSAPPAPTPAPRVGQRGHGLTVAPARGRAVALHDRRCAARRRAAARRGRRCRGGRKGVAHTRFADEVDVDGDDGDAGRRRADTVEDPEKAARAPKTSGSTRCRRRPRQNAARVAPGGMRVEPGGGAVGRDVAPGRGHNDAERIRSVRGAVASEWVPLGE